MSRVTFQLNIAFTLPVNQGDNKVPISAQELWQGIKRGGRNPNDFADYVAACEVLSGGRKDFRRRLTLADGAVHTAKGAHLDQDVLIVDKLHVMSMTVDTGAKSTFLLSYGAGDGEDESNLYLTAMYELKLADIEPESPRAKEIEANYTALARGACRDAVEKIRSWKVATKLQKWKEEDEMLDAAAEVDSN
ncbi:MAG: hypothetical protein ASARMPREDX12_004429 [Alectoria sarmentosa]|nr:MAG: hypothetical protein ASARMPREDX12_004429 [Alectoria sarmentosa]